jgi:hypothetical protein
VGVPAVVTEVKPGDLLVTRSAGRAGYLIRLGAAIRNKPALVNHVAVMHHRDPQGRWWVVEGRPGGVGWRQAADYLRSPYTLSNAKQPKTDAQRTEVTAGAVAMLGTSYDWAAIAQDAAGAFGLDRVWTLDFADGGVPGAVVCSSLAAYLYAKVKLVCPVGGREVEPADWLSLWAEQGWASKP